VKVAQFYCLFARPH